MTKIKSVNPCDDCTHKDICMYRSEMKGNICNTIGQILTNDELVARGMKIIIHCPFKQTHPYSKESVMR